MGTRMKQTTKVLEKLKELDIEYEIVNHEPALTTEQADSFIKGIEGVRTKTMFLRNRKKTQYFMLIMDGKKRVDMSVFADKVQVKRIQMASADDLFEMMKLPPGVVSPFGLLNNADRNIHIYFDKEIMSEKRMSFHPNTNEKTIFLDTTDLVKYIKSLTYKVHLIEL